MLPYRYDTIQQVTSIPATCLKMVGRPSCPSFYAKMARGRDWGMWLMKTNAHWEFSGEKKQKNIGTALQKCGKKMISSDESSFTIFSTSGWVHVWCTAAVQGGMFDPFSGGLWELCYNMGGHFYPDGYTLFQDDSTSICRSWGSLKGLKVEDEHFMNHILSWTHLSLVELLEILELDVSHCSPPPSPKCQWGNISGRMLIIPPVKLHTLWESNDKEHWNCSVGSRWNSTILTHCWLGFMFICHPLNCTQCCQLSPNRFLPVLLFHTPVQS